MVTFKPLDLHQNVTLALYPGNINNCWEESVLFMYSLPHFRLVSASSVYRWRLWCSPADVQFVSIAYPLACTFGSAVCKTEGADLKSVPLPSTGKVPCQPTTPPPTKQLTFFLMH